MKKHWLLYGTLSWWLMACSNNMPQAPTTEMRAISSNHRHEQQAEQPASVDRVLPATNEEDTEETLTLAIPQYSKKIVLKKDDMQKANLSDAHVKELKTWWDSLPQPLQSQVKSNEVNIEVVSTIRTNKDNSVNTNLNDSRIEKTGETLEKIIGSPTEMTYTVNTTVLEKNAPNSNEQATTDILIVKKVPVKLSQFNLEVPLASNSDISNDNIQSLQYWWMSLPEALQEKIKRQEVLINLTVCALDKGELKDKSNQPLGAAADSKAGILTDALHRIIGTYKMQNREYTFAKVQSNSIIEKMTPANAHFTSNYYLRIQVKTNKSAVIVQ